MDLKSGYPYWTVRNGLPLSFPPLDVDLRCDIAIVGAGITGALIAHALAQAGLDVAVFDKRDAGWGSTAASTALLQYEIDTELSELCRRFGVARAVKAYRACAQALHELESLAAHAGAVGFRKTRSLYLASRWHHAGRIRAEGALRRRHGFDVATLERDALRASYGMQARVALLTAASAQLDPYRMTYALLGKLRRGGVRVFDRSAMLAWRAHARGIELTMQREVRVHCRRLVLAAGYEAQQHLPVRVARNRSSYALVTEPVRGGLGALARTLVWESARPYLYMRSTDDGRLLIGGEDDSVDVPAKRDAAVLRKAARLLHKARTLLPWLPLEESFSWGGTFAETDDGLPWFGPHPRLDPRVHFALAYGGNGITYSVIGAAILRARLTRGRHPLQKFFSFERA